ncbi:serine/threonine protein kinase [Mycena vulgaris]|nr:serine/threonine protein kinase [Mycena vulgaris]
MTNTTAWEYPSAFRNPFPAVSSSAATSRGSSALYTGHIAPFILLVAGLEARLEYDPVFFDFNTSFPPPRAPIGSGTSFTVERAEWRDPTGTAQRRGWGRFLALKYVRRRDEYTESRNWKQILLEIRALLHEPIRYHPNIVRFVGLCWGASPGTRSTFPVLHGPLPFSVKKKLCHDVAKGLAILHACDIVHGDLKHENVLVCRNKAKDAEVAYTAKLADFGGSAMDIQDGTDGFLPSWTPPFNAPEARLGLDAAGLKATDVYSFGLMAWRVMLDGKDPFTTRLFFGYTAQRIEDLKRSDELLPIAQESARDALGLHATEDELAILDFVLDNTVQANSDRRSLTKTTAALVVRMLSEMYDLLSSVEAKNEHSRAVISARAPGAHGSNATTLGLWLAKVSHEHDHDYQSAGPGSTPKLPRPDPAQFLFYPERLQPLLDWSLQAEIFRDLENAAVAPSTTSSTQVPQVLASFYLFRCYLCEFGVEFDAERACYWLRQTALSQHECQENYLAQAWCWRIHQALGQPLEVELSVLRQWMMLAISRGHRRCIAESRQIIPLLSSKDDRKTWRKALDLHTYVFLRLNAGVGMPYFVERRLRRAYNLDDMDILDRDIQAELALRGVSSVDQIYVNNRGDGLLHLAAAMGQLVALQHIVANYEPNIDIENQARSETPLLAACRGGHLPCALFLLEQGVRPDGSDEEGEETPLYWLCSFTVDDVPVIAWRLVDAGALLAQHERKRQHRLHTPSVWADPESLLSLPVSPLSRAVIMQSIPAVEALLSLGADPLEGYEGHLDDGLFISRCPIVVAAVLTLPRILRILLSYVDARTPVFTAAEMLQMVVGKFVLPAADPTSLQSRLSRSRMSSMGKLDVVDSLLRLGYSVHGSSQASPIVEAVKLNDDSLFRLLVEHGADIHTTITRTDGSQLSLLQVSADRPAQSRTGVFIAAYLVHMGISVDPARDGTRSAFASAVMNQDFELADLLLQNGADINFSYRLDPGRAWITQNLASVKYLVGPGTATAPASSFPSRSHSTLQSSAPRPRPVPSIIVDVTNGLSVLHFAAIFTPKANVESLILGKMLACILSEKTHNNLATVNSVHPDIGPPLWAATLCCNLEVVAALLEWGADFSIEFMGLTAREVASLEVERIRTGFGVDILARDEALRPWTVLLDYLFLVGK